MIGAIADQIPQLCRIGQRRGLDWEPGENTVVPDPPHRQA